MRAFQVIFQGNVGLGFYNNQCKNSGTKQSIDYKQRSIIFKKSLVLKNGEKSKGPCILSSG